MTPKPQRKKGRDGGSTIDAAIQDLNLAKDTCSIQPVQDAFSSVSNLLTTTGDTKANEQDYVDLGLFCAEICKALDRGLDERGSDDLNRSVLGAIDQLTATVAEIQKKMVKQGKRSAASRFLHTKSDKETIAAWKKDLTRVLQVFNTELAVNTHVTVADIRRNAFTSQESAPSQCHLNPTTCLQTELATGPDANDPAGLQGTSDAHATVSDPHDDSTGGVSEDHHNILKTRTTVSGINHRSAHPHPFLSDKPEDNHTTASNVHHRTAKGREDSASRYRAPYASAPGESPPPPPRTVPGIQTEIQHAISNIRRKFEEIQETSEDREDSDERNRATQNSVHLGESPPPPPRACFGRDVVIEEILGLAENLEPVALIGAAGIGKTSISLTVLHHDRIKARFGNNRRFIRCDQFPASRAQILRRLSEVTGASIENPEDLTPLRPFLSSEEMILVLDNAESILDPQGAESREIYSVVEELSRFTNICLVITSRITTVPPHCRRPVIPTLSMEAACDIFYNIYAGSERSETINDLLQRLDFHALSITLLATTATHNLWDHDELAKEWNLHRAQVLRTDFNESLAATIELSLASPTFRKLGPCARNLLEVVAFFPQGVDKNNLDWLFPSIPDRKNILNKFCVLSLTHRSNAFVTMLAPIRDYLSPQDPKSSPLLLATKDRYFSRLSVRLDPHEPAFQEAQWIVSEDVNVEHLLDVFISIDPGSDDVWDVCTNFLKHLVWYKKRLTVLGPKIEELPDDRRAKVECLCDLSELFGSVGNYAEKKRILTHALALAREREDEMWVAYTLKALSDANRLLGLIREGTSQVMEAFAIYGRCDEKMAQLSCLLDVVSLLCGGGHFSEAEGYAVRVFDILPEEGQEMYLCRTHGLLGEIYLARGEREKAAHHLEVARGIASSFNWHDLLFQIHHSLAQLSADEDEFGDAHLHIEQAKSHAVGDTHNLGCAALFQAQVLYQQYQYAKAESEARRALEIFEELGAEDDAEACRGLLQRIDDTMEYWASFCPSESSAGESESDSDDELSPSGPPRAMFKIVTIGSEEYMVLNRSLPENDSL